MTQERLDQLAVLQGYLASDPDNLLLLADIADRSLDLGDAARARGPVEALSRQAPQDPVNAYRLAVLLFIEQAFEESLAITGRLIDAGAGHVAVLHQHAMTLVRLQRFEQALPLLTRLETEQALFPEVPHHLIRALHYAGDLVEATRYARQHLAKNEGDVLTRGMLSLLYIDQDDFQRAAQFASETLRRAPGNLDALLAGGAAAVAFDNHGAAKTMFRQALNLRPGNGRATMGLGITALLDNDLGAAHDHLEATVKAMPGHLGSWNMLGWIHLLNNDLESARTAFEKANSIDRNFAETHGGLAIVAALGGDWDKATILTDTALRLAPDSLAGRYAQSLIVAHRGRPEQAAKMVETLLEKTAAPGGGSLKEMLQRFSIRAGAGKGATTGSGSTSVPDPGMAPEPDAGSA